MPNQLVKQQILRFATVGIIATVIDFGLYTLFHQYLAFSIAKTLSFVLASVANYLMNKRLTFNKRGRDIYEIMRFASLYLSSLALNVSVNSMVIAFIKHQLTAVWLEQRFLVLLFAFCLATGASMVINFTGQKYWVFKPKYKI